MTATLYRLHTSHSNGGSSWGSVEYFEDRLRFEEKVLISMLEAEGQNTRGPRHVWRACQASAERLRKGKGKGGKDAHCTKVHSAQQLVDGDWIDLSPTLVPPQLQWPDVSPRSRNANRG